MKDYQIIEMKWIDCTMGSRKQKAESRKQEFGITSKMPKLAIICQKQQALRQMPQ
ncbi:hypothetical protein [Niallia circulans]|uniref:hypothetical protein n=1 Tax=Niallia circulans TaxID=1397 RepID=UPI00201E1B4A|nr:hypothetical protein [Niallia circulans]